MIFLNITICIYFQTGLPSGTYCDVISGELANGACSGNIVQVKCDGTADIYLPSDGEDAMLAIHVDSCLTPYNKQ